MGKLIVPMLCATAVFACAASEAFAQRPRFPSAEDAPQPPAQTTPAPAPSQQIAPPASGGTGSATTRPQYYGAIAFTADGSFSTAWKSPSKAEAEADVAKRCSRFGRGGCEVVSFGGDVCAALATYTGAHSGRRYRLSYTGGGMTSPDAQRAALSRCNDDRRTRGRCQLRTVVCGDGR